MGKGSKNTPQSAAATTTQSGPPPGWTPSGWSQADYAAGGRIETPQDMQAGITGVYTRAPEYVAPTPVAATPAPVASRNDLASLMSGSGSDRGGYTTSGRGWGGKSSANSGYGMGGRSW